MLFRLMVVKNSVIQENSNSVKKPGCNTKIVQTEKKINT